MIQQGRESSFCLLSRGSFFLCWWKQLITVTRKHLSLILETKRKCCTTQNRYYHHALTINQFCYKMVFIFSKCISNCQWGRVGHIISELSWIVLPALLINPVLYFVVFLENDLDYFLHTAWMPKKTTVYQKCKRYYE